MRIPERLYYLGLSMKKAYSLRHQKRLPCKVISVGNITVGGTGKTPATIALAQEAKKRGYSPVILTRGYKGSAKGPCFVGRVQGAECRIQTNPAACALPLDPHLCGDEPVLMAEKLKDVPVVKGTGRYEAGIFALQNLDPQLPTLNSQLLFILDDGFQHWRLYRDKNVLLIDSGDPFGNGSLLPFGKLREPLSAMRRADIIVLTKGIGPGGSQTADYGRIIADIRKYNQEADVFLSGHSISAVRLLSGEIVSSDLLKDRKVFCFCALGNPESFRATVSAEGAVIKGFRSFRDHHTFSSDDIAEIREEARKAEAEWIVTTEKDMIKIRGLDLPENLIIIGIDFSAESGFFDAVFAL